MPDMGQSGVSEFVPGQVFRSVRSKSGREWKVGRLRDQGRIFLMPLGWDAHVGGGGVRSIYVSPERLGDPRYWERVR